MGLGECQAGSRETAIALASREAQGVLTVQLTAGSGFDNVGCMLSIHVRWKSARDGGYRAENETLLHLDEFDSAELDIDLCCT